MTTPDIQQAKEWATEITESRQTNIRPDAFAAAEVIQSLPDQWVDAEKLREALDGWGIAGKALRETDLGKRLEALIPAPSLRTLADMTPEEREACQWTQAETWHEVGIIVWVDEASEIAQLITRANGVLERKFKDVAPLPGESKLEWPGDGVEDTQIIDGEPTMPRPEDVPSGQPWLVEFDGDEWVGVRSPDHRANVPWVIVRMDGLNYGYVADFDITLISRMVPEPQP